MRRSGQNREPFFCYLPTNAPHGPRWVAEKYARPYRKPGLQAEYFGMIANLDENMAALPENISALCSLTRRLEWNGERSSILFGMRMR